MGGVRLHLGGLAGWVLDVLVCTVLGSKEGARASDDPPPRPPSLARKAWTGCVQRSCSDLRSRLQVCGLLLCRCFVILLCFGDPYMLVGVDDEVLCELRLELWNGA